MGLVLKDLQDELKVLYDKGKTGNPEPILVGLKTGTAYFNYVSKGQNAAGFPFTAMPGTMELQDEIGKLYRWPLFVGVNTFVERLVRTLHDMNRGQITHFEILGNI